MLAKPAEPLYQPSPTDASNLNSKIVILLHTSNSVTARHDMSSNNSIIIKGTREKKRILIAYQEKFGSEYPESIVTRKKGKISHDPSLHCARMRPSLDKWYQVGDLHLYNIITTIIKEGRVSFSKEDISNLCLVNKDFATLSQRYSIGYKLISPPYKILVWDTSSRIISILIAWKWLAQL
jgi:hypothetical protein